jgi:hypothetical protein
MTYDELPPTLDSSLPDFVESKEEDSKQLFKYRIYKTQDLGIRGRQYIQSFSTIENAQTKLNDLKLQNIRKQESEIYTINYDYTFDIYREKRKIFFDKLVDEVNTKEEAEIYIVDNPGCFYKQYSVVHTKCCNIL